MRRVPSPKDETLTSQHGKSFRAKGLGVLLVFELLIAEVMLKRQSAFSLFEVMIVIAIIGLLSAILVPAVMRANLNARQKTCVNNLRQIDQAIQQWAVETKAPADERVFHTNVAPYLRVLPTCPSMIGGTFTSDYGMTFVKEPPFCVQNNGLEGSPHVFIPPVSAPAIVVKPRGRPSDPIR